MPSLKTFSIFAAFGLIAGLFIGAAQVDAQFTVYKVPQGGTGSTTLTGLLKGNSTNAVQTAVPGTDYQAPVSATAPITFLSNTIACTQASGSQAGCLSSTDWSAFNARLSSTTLELFDKGFFFSTTSAAFWQTQNNFFSTTSAAYWLTTKSTTNLTEGSNLYWTQTRFDNALTATTSLPKITTLSNLSLPYSQLTGTPADVTFSTTSAAYFLSQNQGAAFSTTSADHWGGTKGYLSSISGTFPIAVSGSAISFGGISTSSAPATGNLAYWTGAKTLGTVATTTASCSGTASCSPFTVIGSSPVTITGSASSGVGTSTEPFMAKYYVATSTLIASVFPYASSTAITASNFYGALTGNASTATALQTARAINGTNFDGTVAITITAASSTLLSNNNTWTSLNVFANSTSTLGTITTGWSTKWNATYASTTQVSAASICLTGDTCRTTWPTGGSGAAWAFTPDSYGGVANQSTTTPLWLKDTMVIASTTLFTNASTTGLTITGNTWFPGSGIWNSSGNVGIGTTSPTAKLGLQGAIGVNGSQLYLDADGDVGVGRTDPIAKLDVLGGGSSVLTINTPSATYERVARFGESTNASGLNVGVESGDGTMLLTAFNGGGYIAFGTRTGAQNIERLRLTNAGNLGIGTTTPSSLLHVWSASSPTITAETTSATGNANLSLIAPGRTVLFSNNDNANIWGLFDSTGGAWRLAVDYTTGNVGIGTTTPSHLLTLNHATLPQLAINDTSGGNAWTFRTITNSLYIATSSDSATSTTAALAFHNLSGAATFGSPATTTFSGGINFTRFNLTATSTGSQGINLTGGCFAVNGTCVGNVAGGSPSGSGTELQYRNGGSFGALTNSAFNSAAGWVSLGTTTSMFATLTAGSSTAPQIRLSDNTGGISWAFRNAGGNLYFATSTETATSSLAIIFPSDGGCDGCSDIHLAGGVNLRNAKYGMATSSVQATNTLEDVYTVPVGRRAVLTSAQMYNGSTATKNFSVHRKSGGVYAQVMSTTTVNTILSGSNTMTYVLEAGESAAVRQDVGSALTPIWVNYIEYDASVPLYTTDVASPGSATSTLYTVPTGVSAHVLAVTSDPFGGGIAQVGLAPTIASAIKYTLCKVRPGQTAVNGMNCINSGATTVTGFASIPIANQTIVELNSGDSLQYALGTSLAAQANALIFVTVYEH